MEVQKTLVLDSYCKCGCGNIVKMGKTFVWGHNKSNFKGGYLDKDGYKMIPINGKSIREHRYIMETHLERKLQITEHVHHKNYNKTDNRIENLEVIDISVHGSLEGKLAKGKPKLNLRKKPTYYLCIICKKDFIIKDGQYGQKYCSRNCYRVARSYEMKEWWRVKKSGK